VVEVGQVDPKTVSELRSALLHMRSDNYDHWINMGMALRELGDIGRGLWLVWSATSEKFDAKQAARKWEALPGERTGYQAVFAEAQRQGWVNPASSAAQLPVAHVPKPFEETPAQMLHRMRVNWSSEQDAEVPDIVDGLVADEDVTLLGGHGGIGKSFLGLQIAVAVALGTPVLGITPSQKRVLYYSAEDHHKRLTRRMRLVAERGGYDPATIDQNLCVLDASEVDPLYGDELQNVGTGDKSYFMKHTGATENFQKLQAIVEAFDPQLVVVDGASDTFDGNEIVRREVRAFVKLLRGLHPARKIGVLLMVHIDRGSARGIVSADDGYSGSGQWHNSSRRRIFLQEETERGEGGVVKTGRFWLRVMKNQDGKKLDAMEVTNEDGGLWRQSVEFAGDLAPGSAQEDPAVTLFRLISEYYDRGQYINVSLSPNSKKGVHAVLSGDPRWPPKLRRAKQTEGVVRDMERNGNLAKEPYKTPDRHLAERWVGLRDPSQLFEQRAESAESAESAA